MHNVIVPICEKSLQSRLIFWSFVLKRYPCTELYFVTLMSHTLHWFEMLKTNIATVTTHNYTIRNPSTLVYTLA